MSGRVKVALVAGVMAAGLAAGIILGRSDLFAPPARPEQTVTLHMRNYFFFTGDDTTRRTNILFFRPGTRVRFVVTNDEDTHVLHNFGIPALGVPCGPPMEPGERREVVVVLPDSTTLCDYVCCAHPGMKGHIVAAYR